MGIYLGMLVLSHTDCLEFRNFSNVVDHAEEVSLDVHLLFATEGEPVEF